MAENNPLTMELDLPPPSLENVWESFARLSVGERATFLTQLSTRLTPLESRNFARHLPNIHLYNIDWMTVLPLELVGHIFGYLNPAYIFRCRRVNKNWNTQLSGLCGIILRQNFPDDARLWSNPESIYHAKSHEWALQNALSRDILFKNHIMACSHEHDPFRYSARFQYTDESCAIVTEDQDEIQILSLDAEKGYELQVRKPLPEREDCSNICYTSSFVLCFVDDSYFYIYDVKKDKFTKQTWPNLDFAFPIASDADEDVFVLLYRTEFAVITASGARPSYYIKRSPFISKDDYPDIRNVSVNAKERTFTILGWCPCPRNKAILQYEVRSIDSGDILYYKTADGPFIEILAGAGDAKNILTNPFCGPRVRHLVTTRSSRVTAGDPVVLWSFFFDFNTNNLLCLSQTSPDYPWPDAGVYTWFAWGGTNLISYDHDSFLAFSSYPTTQRSINDSKNVKRIRPICGRRPVSAIGMECLNDKVNNVVLDKNGRLLLLNQGFFFVVKGMHDLGTDSELWSYWIKHGSGGLEI
ncbi:hypothetical protein EX30DRAFT_78722 [Ascodesmis nigricans]|uniref:F-box domain-containing protein n=1 Tax=Ascodesmis nigricans TaxID=341454 RepID=A0A4S2MSX7_9PEZI|nr:hypothetical protein EX30DRAFT_78722 [Ascodesmis nigricans]